MSQRYWEPEIETAQPEKIRKVQQENLRSFVGRVYRYSKYYKDIFDQEGIKPGDIRTVEDLRRIPITNYSADLPAEDFLAVPAKDATVIMSSGGTSGYPKPFYCTKEDMDNWSHHFGRAMTSFGIRESDVVHVNAPWPSFWGGIMEVGAKYIPFYAALANVDTLIRVMYRMGATGFTGGVALFLNMINRAKELGVDLKKTLRMACLFGETWSDAYRAKMEKEFGMEFYDLYGSTDLGSSAADCSEKRGLHVWEDLVVMEILDPVTKEPVPPGTLGEIVCTPLWRQAMGFLRYTTGDMAMWLKEGQCSCGRTFRKMSHIKGRIDQLVRVGKAQLFPVDVEEVIVKIPGLGTEYQILVEKPGVLDTLRTRVECELSVSPSKELEQRLLSEMEKFTGVKCDVSLVAYNTIPRGVVKTARIVKKF